VIVYIVSLKCGTVMGCESSCNSAMSFGRSLEEPFAVDRLSVNLSKEHVDVVTARLADALDGFVREIARVYETPVDSLQKQPQDVLVDKPTPTENQT
jgi:hypothetical protein